MTELNVKIIEHYGVIGDEERGWRKEVNLASWHGGPEQIDIRGWNKDHTKCSKGITLPIELARELGEILIRL